MTTVFLDANIFFSAVRSEMGGSYFVIELAKQNRIHVATVAHALAEAERNISRKIGAAALAHHYENIRRIAPTMQSLEQVPIVLEHLLRSSMPEKDIPILLGALLSEATILLTLDKKHLLRNPKLSMFQLPVLIMTPGDFLQKYFE